VAVVVAVFGSVTGLWAVTLAVGWWRGPIDSGRLKSDRGDPSWAPEVVDDRATALAKCVLQEWAEEFVRKNDKFAFAEEFGAGRRHVTR
jgi:hypothetical protein